MADSDLVELLTSQNDAYSASFSGQEVVGVAGQGLLILTCMDSRIVPHEIFGLKLGDMKVIRNAGGQLNSEIEKDIVLASHLLNCQTIVIMPHTRCAMASMPLSSLQQCLEDFSGMDFSNFNPRVIDNPETKLRADISTLQSNPLISKGVKVLGAIYDVDTGLANWID